MADVARQLGNQVLTMDKLMEKEREIAARTADLARRDREVKLMLQRMVPNWPGKFLCIRPIVYHSIRSEVPTDRIRFVTTCYYTYFITMVLLVYNCIVAGVGMGSDRKQGEDASQDTSNWNAHFGLSILHLTGIVFAFPVWYYPIYKATGTFERNQYNMALVGIGVAFLYDVFMALGFVGYGGCGWLYAIALQLNKQSTTPYYMAIASALTWVIQGIFFIWVFWRTRKYRKQDSQRTDAPVAGGGSAAPQANGVPMPGMEA